MNALRPRIGWTGFKRLAFILGTALFLFLAGCTKTFTEGYQDGNRFNLMYRSEHSRTLPPPQVGSEPYGSPGSAEEERRARSSTTLANSAKAQ